MDGNSLGRALGDAIFAALVIAFLGGGAVFAALWFGGSWLFHHLSIGWN